MASVETRPPTAQERQNKLREGCRLNKPAPSATRVVKADANEPTRAPRSPAADQDVTSTFTTNVALASRMASGVAPWRAIVNAVSATMTPAAGAARLMRPSS